MPAILALHPRLLDLILNGADEQKTRAYDEVAEIMRGDRPRFYAGYPLPPPTDALPGTPEKIQVMCERFRLKQALFQPEDITFETANSLGVECSGHPGNGAGAWACLDRTLDRRAAATARKHVGDEQEIRARILLARKAEREGKKRA
ncbi:MAG: hypothetical protein ACRESF_08190 [Pseudomonas sp.]